jgi:hypothetical protein
VVSGSVARAATASLHHHYQDVMQLAVPGGVVAVTPVRISEEFGDA